MPSLLPQGWKPKYILLQESYFSDLDGDTENSAAGSMENELQKYREQHGYTQKELAAEVGVTRQTINNIERGRYNPSLELAFEIARCFDCTIEDIFTPDPPL